MAMAMTTAMAVANGGCVSPIQRSQLAGVSSRAGPRRIIEMQSGQIDDISRDNVSPRLVPVMEGRPADSAGS